MRVVLLNSGGLDSALVAKYLHAQGVEALSLYVDTNAENRIQAMMAAEETATRYCASHFVSRVDFGQSSTYIDDNGKHHSLPMASFVQASIAMAYARLNGVQEIYTGHRGIASEIRIEAMNEAAQGVTYDYIKPHINTPILTATDYASAATMLGVSIDDLSYTHSCVHAEPCGVCGVCLSRADLWTL